VLTGPALFEVIPAPLLGPAAEMAADTHNICREVLALSDAEIKELAAAGVLELPPTAQQVDSVPRRLSTIRAGRSGSTSGSEVRISLDKRTAGLSTPAHSLRVARMLRRDNDVRTNPRFPASPESIPVADRHLEGSTIATSFGTQARRWRPIRDLDPS
jgi:hypothetical protein